MVYYYIVYELQWKHAIADQQKWLDQQGGWISVNVEDESINPCVPEL